MYFTQVENRSVGVTREVIVLEVNTEIIPLSVYGLTMGVDKHEPHR